jgi:hypothetical protein
MHGPPAHEPGVINACFHACFSIWHRIAVKAAAAFSCMFSCTHQQSGHSPQGSSYRTQEQQSKVRACRSAASPHTTGHDAHVGGLTWRPALSVIHPAPSYPDRIWGVCEGASGAVWLVQAQARLWQADLRRFSQPLGGVSRRAVARTDGRYFSVAQQSWEFTNCIAVPVGSKIFLQTHHTTRGNVCIGERASVAEFRVVPSLVSWPVTVSVGVCRSSINGHYVFKVGRALARSREKRRSRRLRPWRRRWREAHIGRYVIKNAFPADQIGNGRADYEIYVVWPAQGEVHGGVRARAGQLAHTCIAASNNINLKKKVPSYI